MRCFSPFIQNDEFKLNLKYAAAQFYYGHQLLYACENRLDRADGPSFAIG